MEHFTDEEAALLRKTLSSITADPGEAARIFYADLFRRAPETRDLFVNDMTRQGEKLIATLNAVVLQIQSLSSIEKEIEELGLRHVAYGVLPEQYAPVREALLAVLKNLLGNAYTAEQEAVWTKAYEAVAVTMTSAIEKRKSLQRLAAKSD